MDTWLGIRKRNRWASADHMTNNLNTTDLAEWLYSDGSPYDPETQFDMEISRFDEECAYIKASSRFKGRAEVCTKMRAVICQWVPPDCSAVGYEPGKKFADGRTCLKVVTGPNPSVSSMCEHPQTDGTRPALLTIRSAVDMIRESVPKAGAWIGLHKDVENEYVTSFDRGDVYPIYPRLHDPQPEPTIDQIVDLRSNEDWMDTTDPAGENGCVKMGPNGVFYTAMGEENCEAEEAAVCQYRACYTKRGRECIFPFKYRNVSEANVATILTYRSCASTDIYKPWCAIGTNESIYIHYSKNFKSYSRFLAAAK